MNDIWIGRSYDLPPNRILVLGESWYGELEPLATYIPKWAARGIADATFSRIFNSCSQLHTETATPAQRLDWWNTIAFYNFVPGTVGESRSSRPTPTQYRAAKAPFRELLKQLAPVGVWILGKGQAEYSKPVLDDLAVASEVAPHPTSYGVSSEVLRASWSLLRTRITQTTKS